MKTGLPEYTDVKTMFPAPGRTAEVDPQAEEPHCDILSQVEAIASLNLSLGLLYLGTYAATRTNLTLPLC